MARAALLVVLSLAAAARAQNVQQILDSKALAREFNPVLVAYLLDEGMTRLTPKQQQEALEQQISRFREEINVKPGSQAVAAAATLAGMLVAADAGAGIAEGASAVWTGWVDAALVLQKAGYAKDVIPFYENCVRNFPYEMLQARCAVALAAAQPEQALALLTGIVNDKAMPEEARSASLRVLGDLAADPKYPKAQRDAAVDELIKRTEGVMNSTLYAAAVDGLARAKDPRAIEPLRRMTKGMTKGDEIKFPAMGALALVYKDPAGIEGLKAGLKGGMTSRPWAQLYSAATLIHADEQAGFDWAAGKLVPKTKGGGFLSKVMATDSDRQVDPEPMLMTALLDNGNERSRALLAQTAEAHAPGEWVYAHANISLLLLGDASRLDAVQKIAAGDAYYLLTRADAAVALAKQKDFSGVAALASIKRPKPHERLLIVGALGTIDHDAAVAPLMQLLSDNDVSVRLAVAHALADMTAPAAAGAIATALGQSYGDRTAEVHAHLLRTAARRFAKDARTKSMIDSAKASQSASVKFLAASLASGSTPTAPAKKKE
jgi:HEAT repeat protein